MIKILKIFFQGGSRRECCEVVELVGMGSLLGVKLRDCMKDEMVH